MVDIDAESSLAIDIGLFSEDGMRQALDFSMASTIKGLELEIHQDTPYIPALREFLADRYRYWEDDVLHDDPFSPTSAAGGLILLA